MRATYEVGFHDGTTARVEADKCDVQDGVVWLTTTGPRPGEEGDPVAYGVEFVAALSNISHVRRVAY